MESGGVVTRDDRKGLELALATSTSLGSSPSTFSRKPADLAVFRKLLATAHDRLAPMLDAGKTLQEAIAARPTADLDPVWGKGFFIGACLHVSPSTAWRSTAWG